MSRSQMILEDLFLDQVFGPRNGFEPRDWQMELLSRYQDSIPDVVGISVTGAPIQHRFCVNAGTGSGKTKAAGFLVSVLLNQKRIGQLIVVVPNRSILRKSAKDFVKFFGIELVRFNGKTHQDGVPNTKQGYILTYSALMRDPALHRRLAMHMPTMVIFDEIHHLGDNGGAWGVAASEAFVGVRHILSLTGTPYRTDNTKIPFVEYEDCQEDGIVKFKADYTYSLGKAIADGVCRKPVFHFSGGVVEIRSGCDTGYHVVSFDDNISDQASAERLRGAVRYGSATRRAMLAEALEICRREGRKLVIFLGGDTEGEQTPTTDATEFLPSELREHGIAASEYEIVVSDDLEAQKKIEAFGESDKWILISINMISEGTDIPELSAAIFLTSITAKQTTVQRIGRVLRLLSESDPFREALIFMFRDPNLHSLHTEIEKEINQEVNLSRRRRDAGADQNSDSKERRTRTESIGVSGGHIESIGCHGHEWPVEVVERAKQRLRDRGLPSTWAHTLLSLIDPVEVSNGVG